VSVVLGNRNGRPTPAKVTAASVSEAACSWNTPGIPRHTLLANLDALAEHLRGRFVVQVAIDGDWYRTNVYRNAAAAERAVNRAKVRGQRVHVTLVQMLPVGVVVGLGESR
jgi:hypothetical protein